MKIIARFLFALGLFVFLGCDRENQPGADATTFYYDQTQCADPWVLESVGGSNGIRDLVESYLEERGVTVYSVEITGDESVEFVCLACPCYSGNIITVIARERDAATLEGLDFYQ